MTEEGTKNILCRYYLMGQCTKGTDCQFSHNLDSKPSEICKFYQIGACKYKDNCLNRHVYLPKYKKQKKTKKEDQEDVKPEPQVIPNVETTQLYTTAEDVVKYPQFDTSQLKGNQHKKTIMCVYCGVRFENLERYDDFEAHIKYCQSLEFLKFKVEQFMVMSQDKACAICLEKVLLHEKVADRNFGLLENCDHVFCLHCIRDWRKTKDTSPSNVRACPICRVISHYIIPSYYFPPNLEEKIKIIENYKNALRQKHCVYFNHGRAVCPFSTSCFFRHEFPDGTLADKSQLLMNADGILEVYNPFIPEEDFNVGYFDCNSPFRKNH